MPDLRYIYVWSSRDRLLSVVRNSKMIWYHNNTCHTHAFLSHGIFYARSSKHRQKGNIPTALFPHQVEYIKKWGYKMNMDVPTNACRDSEPFDRRREKTKKGKSPPKYAPTKYDSARWSDALNIDTMKCFEEHKILSLYAWIIFFPKKTKTPSEWRNWLVTGMYASFLIIGQCAKPKD